MLEARLYGRTDVGKRREKNEDSFLIDPDLGLCIVADGMGGHLGGERASKLAVATIAAILRDLDQDPETTVEEGAGITPGDFESYLRYAISAASQRIYEAAKKEAALRGMGTTTVLLFYREAKVYIANVGDSRAYLIHEQQIDQVTQDHSLVGEQLRAGFLSPDDVRSHRLKNVITRSVGFQEGVIPDIVIQEACEGNRFLLCSDGLSNLVDDVEIRDVVLKNEPEVACQRLIDIANERGGDDNITVVIAEFVPQASGEPSEESTIEG